MSMIWSFLFITSRECINLRKIFFFFAIWVFLFLPELLKTILYLTFSLSFPSLVQKGNSNVKRHGKELKMPCIKETNMQVWTSISSGDSARPCTASGLLSAPEGGHSLNSYLCYDKIQTSSSCQDQLNKNQSKISNAMLAR